MLATEESGRSLSQSVIQRVSGQIEAKVLSRELKPGAKLNEQAMAAQLGVSRGALREAIRSLEPTGLIDVIPNRGAFVRRVSLEDVLHLYDIRAGLARTAGRLLTTRTSASELKHLFSLHEIMIGAGEAGEIDRYHALNLVFHQALVSYTGNPRLQRLDGGIAKELALFMRRGVFTSASARRSSFEHGQLLDAIKRGDSEGAAAAFEAHILAGKQRMIDSISLTQE
jgi:DNA-binding GntR family transcriptional regulator